MAIDDAGESAHKLLQGALDRRIGSAYAFSFGNTTGPIHRAVEGRIHNDGPAAEEGVLWDLASVTKVFTGLAFLRLVEEGELHLGQRVSQFLEDFGEFPAGSATLWQLLTHSSGLPGRQALYRTCDSPDGIRQAVRSLGLRSAPGSRVEYSSQGFMILGWILEAVTSQPITLALDGLVLAPFGLADTSYRTLDASQEGTVATEVCSWRGRLIHGTVHDENTSVMGGAAGHAGLFSTLGDVERLASALLAIHLGSFTGPIGSAVLRASTRNHTDRLGPARGWSWQLASDVDAPAGDLMSVKAFGHTGFTGTSLFVDPEHERFGVLLTNRVHPGREDERAGDVANRYYNLVASGPLP